MTTTFEVSNLRVAIDEETGVGGLLLADPALDVGDFDPVTSVTMQEGDVNRAIRLLHERGIVLDDDEGDWIYLDKDARVVSLWSVLDGPSTISLDLLELGRIRVLEALDLRG